jgi:hypothetical protein
MLCRGTAGPRSPALWLGWANLTKTMPHTATTPIATAFKICYRLPEKVGFPIFD